MTWYCLGCARKRHPEKSAACPLCCGYTTTVQARAVLIEQKARRLSRRQPAA